MVGQIVHIKDASRSKWRMGKIAQLIQSRDNEIRAAVCCFQMEIQ